MLSSELCGTALLAPVATVAHKRPEEAVIAGGAVTAATLDPPGRIAGAEATVAVIRPISSSLRRGARVALALLLLWHAHAGIMSALACKYT